jgi:stage IV sporulation protein FB
VLLNEPAPSQGDLHFRLLNIPVRVHPMFWLMGLILGSTGSQRSLPPIFVWIVAIFVSVLVHEMGHALAIRAKGVQPWITLYGMGGLTSHDGGRFSPATQILVSLAGPVAGFVLAAIVLVAVKASGHSIEFIFGWPYIVAWLFDGFANPTLSDLVRDLLFVNIWWGLLNLLPILPLDGGRITNEVLNICHPQGALRTALVISLVVATMMAVSGLTHRPADLFRIVLFGSLAYGNYQTLAMYRGNLRR